MTGLRDDDRLREAFRSLSRGAAFSDDCPAADRLWAGARGELPPADVEALAAHVADCGACAEAWRVARDFGTPAAIAAPKAAAPFPWWLAAAAVVVLAAGASLYLMRREPAATPPALTSTAPSVTIGIEKPPVRVSSKYLLTWRGPNDGQKFMNALKTALEPYEGGDYAAAVKTLTALRAEYADTAEPALYQGISMLLSGGGANAIEPLEHARDLAEPEQMEDATWFLAAAYERANRRADARRAAQVVCDAKGPRAAAACGAAAALGGSR